jgi:hypothetical protein
VGIIKTYPGAERLGWPRILARFGPVGMGLGALLGGAVALAGFPDWAELTWQLLQCVAVAALFTALAFWGLSYESHYGTQRHRPPERKKPITRQEFWLARPTAVAAVIVVGVTVALTVAFLLGTGEWYSFADY